MGYPKKLMLRVMPEICRRRMLTPQGYSQVALNKPKTNGDYPGLWDKAMPTVNQWMNR